MRWIFCSILLSSTFQELLDCVISFLLCSVIATVWIVA